MVKVVLSNHLKKDLKTVSKRGYDLELLNDVVEKLANLEPLPPKNRDHNLTGEFSGFRECHIQPDRPLVYRVDGDELILLLVRTGTHSDLF